MAINSRAKGVGGENEFCEWLFLKQLVLTVPKRNLEQVRSGGIDVAPELHPFVYEVKRVETMTDKTLDIWWSKATVDAKRYKDREPVVAFRKNRGDWTFLVSVERILGIKGSYAIIKGITFVSYARKRIAGYLDESGD